MMCRWSGPGRRYEGYNYAASDALAGMVSHLSEEDMERIAEFANTPKYERTPEQLIPARDE